LTLIRLLPFVMRGLAHAARVRLGQAPYDFYRRSGLSASRRRRSYPGMLETPILEAKRVPRWEI